MGRKHYRFEHLLFITFFCFLTVCLPLLAATGTVANAQESKVTLQSSEVREFSISPQPLGSALAKFASQANLQVLFPSEITKGKQSVGVTGMLPPEAALKKLLEGTGLDYLVTDTRTITLRKVEAVNVSSGQRDDSDKKQGVTTTDQGRSDAAPVVRASPITVEALLEGTVTESYRANDSFAATRTDTSMLDTPQSAQSITRQVVEDTAAFTLGDTYDYLAGITRDNTQGGLQGDEYLARGFETQNILLNGNRTSSASTLDTANVERIEALRGPTAVLFGKGDPGGLINIITKQPLLEPQYRVNVLGMTGVGGSDGKRLLGGRGTIDLGGPLTDDKRLRYRLNGALDYKRSFRQDVNESVIFVAPVVEYEYSDNTIVNVELVYQKREDTFDRGLFLVDGEFLLDRDFNIAKGHTGKITKDYLTGTLRVEHEFFPGWTGRLGVYGSNDVREGKGAQATFVPLTGSMLLRHRRQVDARDRFFTVQPEVVGEFQTGSIGHTLLLGLDYTQQRSKFLGLLGPNSGPIDVLNPDFSAPIPPVDRTTSISRLANGNLEGSTLSLYGQDQIDLTDQIKVLFGFRYDQVDVENTAYAGRNRGGQLLLFPPDTPSFNFKDSKITPRAGIVYQPTKEIGLYASYSESYRPPDYSFGFADQDGNPVDPETAQSYEAGVKFSLLNEKLGGTFAVYRIDKENVLESVPGNPTVNLFASRNLGKVRGEGIELDVSGDVTKNISVGLNYAHTHTRTSSPTALFPQATLLRNIPRNAVSLLGSYRFQTGAMKGLRVFGNMVYESKKKTDTSATITTTIPSYVRYDLGADYRLPARMTKNLGSPEDVRLRFMVENLTDEEYYTSAAGRANIGVGDPLRLRFWIDVRF